MSITNKDRRTIFGLARELGLDDDVRRDMQQKVTGKISTTDMTGLDAGKLIAHMRAMTRPHRRIPKRAGRTPANLNRVPRLQKIEALLASMQLSWQYAENIAWRITGGTGQKPQSLPGVQRLEWVRQGKHFDAIIAALYVEQKKHHGLRAVNGLLDELGKDSDWLESQDLPLKDNWRRSVSQLEFVAGYLDAMLHVQFSGDNDLP